MFARGLIGRASSLITTIGILTGTVLAQGAVQQLLQETGINDSRFGAAVNGIGDVDGDSIPDYIVGAPRARPGIFRTGSAYVMSGAGGEIQRHDGTNEGDLFGMWVDGVPDLDSDGVPDYVVGAPANFGGFLGEVELRSGATGFIIASFVGTTSPQLTLNGVVAGLEDIDGDGFGDFALVGDQGPGAEIFVMDGEATAPFFTITAPPGATIFASAVAPAGDVNNDGIGDIAVAGSPSCWIFSGANGALLVTLAGAGTELDGIGDVNGDGRSDVAVGNKDSGVPATGQVRVHSGLTGAVLWSMNGDAQDNFGVSVSSIGDIDGDGSNDVLAGAPHNLSSTTQTGYARLLSGTDGCILGEFTGDQGNENFGRAVGNAGDIDSDGADDLLVGSPKYEVFIDVGRAATFKGQLSGSPLGIAFCLCNASGSGPCSNDATSPAGCKNSTGQDGLLEAFGTTSVQRDDLFFVLSGAPANSLAVFATGNPTGSAAPFFNGLLCITNLQTFPFQTTDANGVAVLGPCLTGGNPAFVGATGHFQVWYQDLNATLPCTKKANLSQGLIVTLTP